MPTMNRPDKLPDYASFSEYDVLEAQFMFDSRIYILEQARYVRANGQDAAINRHRKQALENVDRILDRFIDGGHTLDDQIESD